jgi:hypothetical protein
VTEIKNFYKEFSYVVKSCLQPNHQVYLIDILVQMNFLDANMLRDNRRKLGKLVFQFKENFMIYSKSGEYTGESEDIIKNLFKVLCGILNLQIRQRGHNQLSEDLLKTYCEAIKPNEEEPDFTIMDQLHTIKNLINRKSFTLGPN